MLCYDSRDKATLTVFEQFVCYRTQAERHRSKVGTAEFSLPVELNYTISLLRSQIAVDLVQVRTAAPRQYVILAGVFDGVTERENGRATGQCVDERALHPRVVPCLNIVVLFVAFEKGRGRVYDYQWSYQTSLAWAPATVTAA